MDNLLIFDDGEQRIEIDRNAANFIMANAIIKKAKGKEKKLTPLATAIVTEDALDALGMPKGKYKKVVITKTVPILTKLSTDTYNDLLPPYNVFSHALLLISSAFIFLGKKKMDDNWRYRLESLIEDFYALEKQQECYLRFLQGSEVTACLFYLDKEKEELIILPFIIEEPQNLKDLY